MSHDHDPDKVSPDGRYAIHDGFDDLVECTDDFPYAKRRAETNDGYVTEGETVVFDSAD